MSISARQIIIPTIMALALFGCAGIQYINNIDSTNSYISKDKNITDTLFDASKTGLKSGSTSIQSSYNTEELLKISKLYAGIKGKTHRDKILPKLEKIGNTGFFEYDNATFSAQHISPEDIVLPTIEKLHPDIANELKSRINDRPYLPESRLIEIIAKGDDTSTIEYMYTYTYKPTYDSKGRIAHAIAFSGSDAQEIYMAIYAQVEKRKNTYTDKLNKFLAEAAKTRFNNRSRFSDPNYIARDIAYRGILGQHGYRDQRGPSPRFPEGRPIILYNYQTVTTSTAAGYVEFSDDYGRYLVKMTATLTTDGNLDYAFSDILATRKSGTVDYNRPWPNL